MYRVLGLPSSIKYENPYNEKLTRHSLNRLVVWLPPLHVPKGLLIKIKGIDGSSQPINFLLRILK